LDGIHEEIEKLKLIPTKLFVSKKVNDKCVSLELIYHVDESGKLMDEEDHYILDNNHEYIYLSTQ